MMNNEEKILSLLGQVVTDVTDLKTDVADLKTIVTKVAVTQENIVIPQLQLLYKGQVHLQETLAPKSELESLKEEMDLMKMAIRTLSHEVNELKKAQ